MDLKLLIFQLTLRLTVGTFLTFGLLRSSQVGSRYFLYHGLGITLIALAALFILGPDRLPPTARIAMFTFLVGGAAYAFSATASRFFSLPLFLVAAISGGIAVTADTTAPVHALLSSLLLGSSMAAMCLGHWYLVQPKLSIDELGRLCWLLILCIVIRFLLGTYLIGGRVVGMSEAEIYRFFLSSTPGIFLLMRWTWGLLGPLILAYLIWGTVRIRSTQSATGILYVAVLTILTGETVALYLSLFHGITT